MTEVVTQNFHAFELLPALSDYQSSQHWTFIWISTPFFVNEMLSKWVSRVQGESYSYNLVKTDYNLKAGLFCKFRAMSYLKKIDKHHWIGS